MSFDLNDPKVFLRADVLEDPSPLYDELRRRAPVWQIPGQDTYLVSEPSLIRDATARPEDFSSNLVSLLHNDGDGCPVPLQITRYGDPVHVLATSDPPLHTRHRRMLQPRFSPNEITALEPKVRSFVDAYLEELRHEQTVEIVGSFSDQIPTRTVCELIGLPDSDVQRIIDVVLATGALLDGVTMPHQIGPAAEAAMDLTAYVHEQLKAMLARPADARYGLLGMFSAAIESDTATEDEVRDMLITLVSAGSETTASLIATAIATLARDVELQDLLRAEPERIPETIEAILRADGPFQFHYRYAPHDTELGGVTIPAHSRVLLMWAAANRPKPESDVVSEPSEGRGLPPHYAFGKGMHFCIGAPLARMEARVALEQLLSQTQRFTIVVDQPPVRRPSIFIRRHRTIHLNVDWVAR